MAEDSGNTRSLLLRIPPELRNNIYELVFAPEDCENGEILAMVPRRRAALTQVCQQIRSESYSMFYSKHYFIPELGQQSDITLAQVISYLRQLPAPLMRQLKGFWIDDSPQLDLMRLTYISNGDIESSVLSVTSLAIDPDAWNDAAEVVEPLLRCYKQMGFETVIDEGTLDRCKLSLEICPFPCRECRRLVEDRTLLKALRKCAKASQDEEVRATVKYVFLT